MLHPHLNIFLLVSILSNRNSLLLAFLFNTHQNDIFAPLMVVLDSVHSSTIVVIIRV